MSYIKSKPCIDVGLLRSAAQNQNVSWLGRKLGRRKSHSKLLQGSDWPLGMMKMRFQHQSFSLQINSTWRGHRFGCQKTAVRICPARKDTYDWHPVVQYSNNCNEKGVTELLQGTDKYKEIVANPSQLERHIIKQVQMHIRRSDKHVLEWQMRNIEHPAVMFNAFNNTESL